MMNAEIIHDQIKVSCIQSLIASCGLWWNLLGHFNVGRKPELKFLGWLEQLSP